MQRRTAFSCAYCIKNFSMFVHIATRKRVIVYPEQEIVQ